MKRVPWLSVIFCGLLFFGNLVAAEAPKAKESDSIRVKAELDKAFLTIGDKLTYTVTVEHAPDIEVLSNIPAPASDILEIKKIEDISKKESKKVITGRKFILTTYRLGEFILDPVTIQYRVKGQPIKSLQTNKLYLTVRSVAGGKPQEDIRDVKSVVPLEFRLPKWFWALLGVGVLGACYGIYRKFFHKKGDAVAETSPLTAEEEALLRLRELFETDLLKRGLTKQYYLRLSEILRIFFEKRYKILAVELTTVETLRALKPLALDREIYQKIQYVLESADLAKFAKWVPSPSEIMQIDRKAEEIVKESTPVPSDTPAAEVTHGV